VVYLQQMADLIGRDRIHVVDSAEFFADPQPVYDRVLDFLGLPHPPELGEAYPEFARHNARPRGELPAEVREELTVHFEPFDERLAGWLGRTPSWRS
jgi:hypothetical protein